MRKRGTFIISLDFELNWGVHDVFTLEQYEENLRGTREAIKQMLRLFKRYDIHATWATVGLLFYHSKAELLDSLPSILPSYENKAFSPYDKLKDIGENEEKDPYHFGHSIIQEINKCPGQEIATHTFSHYYCLEEGQTAEQFEADLQAALKVNQALGHPVNSIVFPRNQLNENYLAICKKYGIRNYRGNERSWMYKASKFQREGSLKRLLRLVDSYVNLTGHHTYSLQKVGKDPLLNLPSSRFLRPYDEKLKQFEQLRLRRIKKSMIHAAKHGKVYHLWWHPHNFGKEIEENIIVLQEILELAVELRQQYQFESCTMEEAAGRALGKIVGKSIRKIIPQSQCDM